MDTERKLVTMTQAAEELGVSRQAIHYHVRNSKVYSESVAGTRADGAPILLLVDLDDLRQVVKATEPTQ